MFIDPHQGVLLALLLTLIGQQQSSQPPPPGPGFHTTVIVTGERRPEKLAESVSSMAVLEAAELQQVPAQSLSEVLTAVPGYVVLLAQPGAGRPVLITRGFFGGGEAEYVTGLADDAPLGDADSGLVEWRLIPTWLLDRVEVVRGAASAGYGDTAFAGVVHAITRRTQPGRVELSMDHRGSISAGAIGSIEQASWTLLGAASAGQDAGFRRHADETHGLLHVRAARTDGDATLRLSTNVSHLRREEPGAIPLDALRTDARRVLPGFRADHDTTGRFTAAADYGVLAGGGWSLVARGHVALREADRRRTVLLLAELPLPAEQNADSSTVGITAQAALSSAVFRPSESHVGVDLARDAMSSVYAANDLAGTETAGTSGSRERIGIYAAHSVQLLSRVRMTGGVRYDRIRDVFAGPASNVHAWSPRIGAVFSTGGDSRAPVVYAQANRAFKAPTLNQRFDNRTFPDFRGGTFTISNPELRPQRSVNLEGGVRQTAGRFSWDAAAYRMRVTDEIDFDLRTFRYGNIAASHHHGVEVNGQLAATASASGGVAYSWMRVYGTNDPARRQLKNIPEHVVRAWVRAVPAAQIAVTAVFTSTHGAFLDEDATFSLAPGRGLDLRAERTWAHFRLAAELLNSFDEVRGAYGYVVPDFQGQEQPFVYPASGRTARLRCSFLF